MPRPNKSKTKAHKPKRAGPARQRTQRMVVQGPTPMARQVLGKQLATTHSQVCSLTDPFCPHARNARIPDDDSTPSFAVQFRMVSSLTTDANGKLAASFRPNPNQVIRAASTITGSVLTAFGGYFAIPDYTALASTFSEYRIVSWGVRFWPLPNTLNQQGTLKLITLTDQAAAGMDAAGGLFTEWETMPFAGTDAHWVSKPLGVTWKDYISGTSTHSYQSLLVFLDGGVASTNSLAYEIVMNVELTANHATLAAVVATPGQPHSPTVLQAASAVHAKVPGIQKNYPSLWNSVKTTATNVLMDAASAMLPFGGRMAASAIRGFFGGAPRYSPMIEDVD